MTQLIVKGQERKESKEREKRQSRAVMDAHRHSHTFAGGRLESGCLCRLSLCRRRVRELTRFGGSSSRRQLPCSAMRAAPVSSVVSP